LPEALQVAAATSELIFRPHVFMAGFVGEAEAANATCWLSEDQVEELPAVRKAISVPSELIKKRRETSGLMLGATRVLSKTIFFPSGDKAAKESESVHPSLSVNRCTLVPSGSIRNSSRAVTDGVHAGVRLLLENTIFGTSSNSLV
jgi:hypothetical protein